MSDEQPHDVDQEDDELFVATIDESHIERLRNRGRLKFKYQGDVIAREPTFEIRLDGE